MATHPAGTRIGTIRRYDRSTKVTFRCPDHPEKTWRSKDPRVSAWFIAEDANPAEPPCECPVDDYLTTAEYTDKAA
ncbi:hypothetical protein [Arthrobacter mobilis]|uniref:Uncharacterized protein n=1 Tax=Arthrobacter mobilis TaxID=2724944 RepID=A0A7X6HHQ5_9MICC|nr:hypothetical protein [Arthrobacter mobilis]NKX55967.1 hypothetical protein [Arthrobacter mobilis]